MNKEIILATIDDLEELIGLLHVLFSQDIEFEPDYEKQKRGLKQIISTPETGEILVLKIDGKILGMVSLLYSISTALGGKVATLEDMVIDKDFRGKGLGKELLKAAINFSKTRSCLRLTLLTDFDNDNAQRLYSQAGFTFSKMIPMRLVFDEETL